MCQVAGAMAPTQGRIGSNCCGPKHGLTAVGRSMD